MSELREGAKAPGFTLPADNGETLSLGDYAGKQVVLYFYPKDDTSGCTKQAIGFTEKAEAFAEAGTAVIGVSKDSVKSHDKFIQKHGLHVRLVSDEDTELNQAYGVWKEKSMYGKTYMGTERSTFLIDENGNIARIWRKVKVPGHVEEVLEAACALQKGTLAEAG